MCRRAIGCSPTDLTVRENLETGGTTLPNIQAVSDGMERVFALFPALKERWKQRAGTLSGGKKQMLALGNALILSPKLLPMDEPSLGLAPILVQQIFDVIQEINHHSVKGADDAVNLTANPSDKRTLLRVWANGGSHYVVVDENKAG